MGTIPINHPRFVLIGALPTWPYSSGLGCYERVGQGLFGTIP